jgi:hypothetical protein
MKKIFAFAILLTAALACQEDEKITDTVFEFVSFKGNETVTLNEAGSSEDGYPVVVQLWASKPYTIDIDLTLQTSPTNSVAGVDFVAIPQNLKIKAGKLVSDTLWIKTVNNAVAAPDERSIELTIETVSESDIKIGLGVENPNHQTITFNIVDDECSANTSVFNSNLNNIVNWGGDDVLIPATGVLVDDELTVTGNLIDYGTFSNGSITIILSPESPGATRGSATFGTQFAGTDNDGYNYQFEQTGTGTYDVCAGTVSVAYDIYYEDGGWVYWYSVTNVFTLISCTETVDIFDASITNTLDWGDGPIVKSATGSVTGDVLTVSGDLIDYGPFSNASLSITLTPYTVGGTKGAASFGEQETGTDDDGYMYKFVQTGTGSYDVCDGKVTIAYDIYYEDGGWVYWYSVTNEFTIE